MGFYNFIKVKMIPSIMHLHKWHWYNYEKILKEIFARIFTEKVRVLLFPSFFTYVILNRYSDPKNY